MRILLYLALGWGIGTLSGALGIGGGILLVPALMWLCGFDYPRAAGTSLAILVPPIGLLAAMRAYADKRVDLEAAACVAVAFAGGAYVGAVLVNVIPAATLRLAFGLMMLFIAMRFVLSADTEAANAAAGLFAALMAWLAFLALRALGRRHLPRPELGSHIRQAARRGRGEGDYQI